MAWVGVSEQAAQIIAAKDAEIERLRRERDDLESSHRSIGKTLARIGEENERLRAALCDLDLRIFNDPQVIERAGEWRELIRTALVVEQSTREAKS